MQYLYPRSQTGCECTQRPANSPSACLDCITSPWTIPSLLLWWFQQRGPHNGESPAAAAPTPRQQQRWVPLSSLPDPQLDSVWSEQMALCDTERNPCSLAYLIDKFGRLQQQRAGRRELLQRDGLRCSNAPWRWDGRCLLANLDTI